MRTHTLFMMSLIGVACTEYTVIDDNKGIDDITGDEVPIIVVNPTEVDFQQVEVNEGLEQVEVVTVSNQGDANLTILDMYLEDPHGPFDFTLVNSMLVAPGQSTQFEVIYLPDTSASDSTRVFIDSNDPATPTAEVLLLGTGVAPIIEVDPMSYDFGTLWVGCDAILPLEVRNVGTSDLVVYSFTYSTASTDMAFENVPDMNGSEPGLFSLAPSEMIEVYVSYAPYDEYDDVAYLAVESNDPYTPRVQAVQTGDGAFFGHNTDIFEQPEAGMTDIIFALDKSGSMYGEIESVLNNMDTFVTTLVGLDSDFQVAATVEDAGCIVGSDLYIDNTFSTTQASATMSNMIAWGVSHGSNTERAFMLLEACLAQASSSSGCNYGLVRDAAKLNLVGVSDEPEQSVNDWSYYLSLFQSYKADPDDLVFHAIGGDYPGGCSGATPYTGMYESVMATGGIFLSICATDWASHMEVLAEGSVAAADSFELTQLPVPETITVKIDGITTTVGWSYASSANSVSFETEHIPDPGSTVEISYAIYGDCEG